METTQTMGQIPQPPQLYLAISLLDEKIGKVESYAGEMRHLLEDAKKFFQDSLEVFERKITSQFSKYIESLYENAGTEKLMLTVKEAAQMLGFKEQTVRDYFNEGKLDGIKINNQIRIYKHSVDVLLGLADPAPYPKLKAQAQTKKDKEVTATGKREEKKANSKTKKTRK